MIVLLSPAKSIEIDRKLNSNDTSIPVFISEAEGLAKKLSKFSAKKLAGLMHLSPQLADLNVERYQEWKADSKPSDQNATAISAFTGEVYRGFDSVSLKKDELEVAQDKVRILSGLYGVLKPLDVIYPYRLEMGTSWAVTPSKKNLYAFWGKKIAEELNSEGSDVIVNLASNEYFKAVDKKTIKGRIITPVFKEFKNGDYKVVMVYAKKARGMMARYIVQNNIEDPELIKGFDVDGYHFDANLSTENEWVFTR